MPYPRTEAPLPAHWTEIHVEEDLKRAVEHSHRDIIGIFKHSTRCSRSHAAFYNLQGSRRNDVPIYYLDLLAHRDISNLIQERFGVVHQSPQLILLHLGQLRAYASHESISLDKMLERLPIKRG